MNINVLRAMQQVKYTENERLQKFNNNDNWITMDPAGELFRNKSKVDFDVHKVNLKKSI